MALQLHAIEGWADDLGCAPTALCAVSGCSPDEVKAALQAVNPGITKFDSIAPKDWMRALERLGIKGGVSCDYVNDPYEWRQDINTFLAAHSFTEPVLVVAFGPQEGEDGHVFATSGGMVVDTYTDGRIETFTGVRDNMKHFRVKYVVRLFESGD